MFCPRCGSRIPDGAKFCASCGTQLGERAAAPVPAPAPKPRRRRAPVVAAAIALVVLLAAGGVAAWWFLLRPKPVYVCTESRLVTEVPLSEARAETFLAVALVPSSVSCMAYVVPGINMGIAANYEYEHSERGALTSCTQEALYADQAETYSYGLDECGNTSSRSEDGMSLDITYDDQQRPIAVTSSDGTRSTYSYDVDGSYTCIRTDADGGAVDQSEFDSDGKVVSRATSYGSSDATLKLSYEDGFLTNASWVDSDGTVEAQVTGTLRRDGQGRVVEVALSASGDADRASIFGLDYYDRVCLEYDENGNISRCYAPWKSADAWQVFSNGDSPGVLSTENVYDYHLEYERVDNPTPLVRVLGGRSLLS